MKELIKEIVNLQYKFNSSLDENWVYNDDINFRRAIWLECAELMDSTDWKWWKNQQTDIQNIEVELVDILHFVVSILIRYKVMLAGSVEKGIKDTIEDMYYIVEMHGNYKGFNESMFQYRIEELVKRDLVFFDNELFKYFVELVNVSPININDVLKMYIAKNVLNNFRQDNGYKDGSYIKHWNGVEDNVVCWRLSKTLNDTKSFEDELYKLLEREYSSVKSGR